MLFDPNSFKKIGKKPKEIFQKKRNLLLKKRRERAMKSAG